ncbi:unnamed protein product [Gongylonema pulchrum]|uniref:Expressed conserved protein n=1 Tax=Gongylonema pulchrum TaxID=637853 RepID=A0A183DFE4_9BILA|nr:unnamed protein product [Gongylonema pulchrum]
MLDVLSFLCRSLSRDGCRAADAGDDAATDMYTYNAVLETPSKAVKSEMDMEDDKYGFELLCETNPIFADICPRSTPFCSSVFDVPEQANGPLESSLCEPASFLEQHMATAPASRTGNELIVLPSRRTVPSANETRLLSQSVGAVSKSTSSVADSSSQLAEETVEVVSRYYSCSLLICFSN